MPSDDDQTPFRRYLAPRYWPTWLLLGWMKLAAILPYPSQIVIGRWFGRMGMLFAGKTRRTVQRNLEICFPDLSESERSELAKRHFEAVGAAFSEMGFGWFAPRARVSKVIRIEGQEHIDAAKSEGNGIIVLCAHFTSLETSTAILGELFPGIKAVYRPQPNELLNEIIRTGRAHMLQEQIPKDNIRAMVRTLRDGGTVAYLADLAVRGSHSELIPFFGEPALTTTTVSRLAKMTNATVLTYFFRRLPGREGYLVEIGRPFDNFPTDDPIADTGRIVRRLEDHIRLAPEQYMWTYRRFKGRPDEYPDVYRRDS